MLGLLAVVAVVVAGCSGASQKAPSTSTSAAKPTAPGTTSVARWPVWLCLPEEVPADDWCNVNLTTTAISANGTRTVSEGTAPSNPPVDCFYVYPTVSTESRGNSDLTIQPAEAAIATVEAGRFE